MIAYLREQLESKEKELFLVVSQEVERSHSWQLDSNAVTNNCVPSATATSDKCQNEMVRTASTETEVEWQELNVCNNCPSLANETRHCGDTGDHEFLDEKMMDALNLNIVAEDTQGERTMNTPLIQNEHT